MHVQITKICIKDNITFKTIFIVYIKLIETLQNVDFHSLLLLFHFKPENTIKDEIIRH
nr:MAG TPA: hypothetical protein [Caudoviricetes sp.]